MRSAPARWAAPAEWAAPIPAGAAEYTAGVVRDIAERYAVDGIHLDYVRYPTRDFDYSRETLAAFRRSVVPALPPADQRRYDQRLATEPLLYTQAFPERWRTFRTERLTALLQKIVQNIMTSYGRGARCAGGDVWSVPRRFRPEYRRG